MRVQAAVGACAGSSSTRLGDGPCSSSSYTCRHSRSSSLGIFRKSGTAFTIASHHGRPSAVLHTEKRSRRQTRLSTVCMAHPRRVARVAKQLAREVGDLLLFDKVLQKAVCPEKRVGVDDAVSAIASVTEVRVSGDLQVAKVYLSIFSDEQGREVAMRHLTKLQGYVRKNIGARMSLRLTPEIRFIYDESIEQTDRVMKLLERIKLQQAGEVEPPPITLPSFEDYADLMEDSDEDDDDEASEEGGDAAAQQDQELKPGEVSYRAVDDTVQGEDEEGFLDLDEDDEEISMEQRLDQSAGIFDDLFASDAALPSRSSRRQ